MPLRNNISAWLRRLFGRETPPSDDAYAPTPVALHRLLYLLLPALDTQGFLFSPDRYIILQRMLAAMPPDMPLLEWRNLLCPVLATDVEQQRIFYDLFDRFEAQINREAEAEKAAAQPEPPVEKPEAKTAATAQVQQPKPPPAAAGNVRTGDESPSARRPLVVELDECTAPPFSWNIVADSEGISIEVGPQFGRTLIQLRRRETAGYLLPDLPASIRATIAEGGVPTFRYRIPTRPTEYLLLVERYATDDHRAALFDHFYHTLRHNDVIIERFFYQGDLRLCRNERHPAGLSLQQLRYRYPDARLVVMGVGHRFISPKTSEPAQWTRALFGWRRRMLLTPVPRQEWGARERALQHLFNLLPASLHSLHFLSDAPDEALHGGYDALPEYVRRIAEVEPLKIEEPVMRALRRHFDPGQLCWIATCAVYPALHYELTLRLGKKLSESLGYNLLTATNLLALARLPWFTEGRIPTQARTQLIEWLEHRHPEQHRQVLDYLHALMENNPPPERSAAWAEHQINLALLNAARSLNPDAETLAQLRAVVKRLDRQEKRGDFVLPRHWETLLKQAGFPEPPPPPEPPPSPGIENILRAGMIFAEQYRLDALIGQGGFGQVWQALRIEPGVNAETIEMEEALIFPDAGQIVAIKIFTGGERYYDYCTQEFKQTNRLEHPHIIRLYDCGMWNGLPWQTMPLYRSLAATGEWEEDELWRLLRDMADALTYLHAHKPPISHNDIKPGQFLQDQDGAYLLADFGISGELLQVAARDIRPIVNPEFLPPECRSDIYYRSLATDVYALGASLYHLATGRPPIAGRSSMTSQSAAPAGPAPLPTQFSIDLNYLLMQCLSDVPAERPTAEKIRQVAGDWLAERGLRASKRIEEMEKAFEYYQKATEIKSDDDAAWFNISIDIKPDKHESWYNMGIAYSSLGQKEKAIECYQKAIMIKPDYDAAWYNMGIAYSSLGQKEKAIEELKELKNSAEKNQQYEKSADLKDEESKMAHGLAFDKKQWEKDLQAKRFNVTEENVAAVPDSIDMVFIPGGAYDMGDVMGDNEQNDETVHRVTVADFYIGRTEVTFAEYDVFCDATRREKPSDSGWGRSNRPVINVSWYDAVEYCNWLSAQHGLTPYYTIDKTRKAPNNTSNSDDLKWTVTPNRSANGYRLPTEAEWEYAAREGGKKVRFGNGKDIIDPKEVNFDASEGYKKPYSVVGEYIKKTVPVGSLNSPNALELDDMSGNVWEWCWDWYGSYPAGAQNNPMGAGKGSHRVLRGGSWLDDPLACRAATRADYSPMNRGDDLGFRLARS